MPTYRATFPDFIGMVTKKGDKFNFTGGLLETTDPDVIETLEERVTRFKDVKKISEEEAAKISQANQKAAQAGNLEEKLSANPDGETTITPQALMERIRLQQAAQDSATVASQQLQVAQTISSGIVSSATLEAAKPGNTPPAATTQKR